MRDHAKQFYILAMSIFGTIGIFRRYIPLPSSVLALARGTIGTIFLLFLLLVIKRQRLSAEAISRNFKFLVISGALIGFNWILLFEAYQYTTVATATLCYYMAPVLVIMASPFFFQEKLTPCKATVWLWHWQAWCWYLVFCRAVLAAYRNYEVFCWA